MGEEDSCIGTTPRRLLKYQVQLTKNTNSDRYEIIPIPNNLSFEKGFFVVLRACQMLAQQNDGIVLVGLAGPSGAGKTVFTEKIMNFMPGIAILSMDNYNDGSRIVDGNFDDPRLTDYDTLLDNIHGLKAGKEVQVPIYDFKCSFRTGYSTVGVPSSRIVIIEGIYALSEKLRPLLDLRVSVMGGVHFDLVKRVLRDIQRAGQEPEEIIHQISETVYPMYKAFIEPDLQTAHIKIVNKFNPFSGFQSPTYILKSSRGVSEEQIRTSISEEHTETTEQTYDIYLLPPGEDPESCQSYLRMRNKDGKYNLMFEEIIRVDFGSLGSPEWVTDVPFVISPRITFEVSVRLLGGLMALGYTIAAILKRNSHVFFNDKVTVKVDWLEQLNRHYIQVQGKERTIVKSVADQLGLGGSYIPRTYIEQIQLEKLVKEVMEMPEDLKTKLSLDEDFVSSPRDAFPLVSSVGRGGIKKKYTKSTMSHSFSIRDKNLSEPTGFSRNNRTADARHSDSHQFVVNEGVFTQLSEHISTLNDRMDEFMSKIEELNSRLENKDISLVQKNLSVQVESGNVILPPTSHYIPGLCNGSLSGSATTEMHNSFSSSHLAKDSHLMEEVLTISRYQRQVIHQLDNLGILVLNKFRGDSTLLPGTHTTSRDSDNGFDPFYRRPPILVAIAAASSLLAFHILKRRCSS